MCWYSQDAQSLVSWVSGAQRDKEMHKCLVKQPVAKFYKQSTGNSLQSSCKKCHLSSKKEHARVYRQTPHGQKMKRAREAKRAGTRKEWIQSRQYAQRPDVKERLKNWRKQPVRLWEGEETKKGALPRWWSLSLEMLAHNSLFLSFVWLLRFLRFCNLAKRTKILKIVKRLSKKRKHCQLKFTNFS